MLVICAALVTTFLSSGISQDAPLAQEGVVEERQSSGGTLTSEQPYVDSPIRGDLPPQATTQTVGTDEGHTLVGCNNLGVVVDKEDPLPAHYAPEDLVNLKAYGVPTLDASMQLRREAAEHLLWLMTAAEADGEGLVVASAYRSFSEQRAVHANWRGLLGEEVKRVSALPGKSEHQLGTTVDFTNSQVDHEINRSFGATSAARWLVEHAAQYGFVLSYPEGKEARTGYTWEPWHYRYVGVRIALHHKDSGLDLNTFLSRKENRPRCD